METGVDKRNYNDLVSFWKGRNSKDYQKYISEDVKLHKNSEELVKVCREAVILGECNSCLEIGCGCGRNLSYLLKEAKFKKIYGNDLSKDSCFKYMDKNLSRIITFYEQDTLSFIENSLINVDMMVASDHLMYLRPDSVKIILDSICKKWKPKYLLIRETTKEAIRFTRKFAHDFSILFDYFDCLYNGTSLQDANYKIYLLKLK